MSRILTLNGGSSSIRFALFAGAARELSGKLDRIGQPDMRLTVDQEKVDQEKVDQEKGGAGTALAGGDSRSAAAALLEWLDRDGRVGRIDAVGHRIVHGMQLTAPQVVTAELIERLTTLTPVDPEHLPREIELMKAFHAHHAQVPQVVCFDTAFHRDMPRVATQLPIPRRYAERGVRRYGFHGISYTYLLGELHRLGDPAAQSGRVIMAHLGNGASMVAVRDGVSIDTSMGFTPSAGLVMGTRAGDLDPGLLSYLLRADGLEAKSLDRLTSHESGMLGISETSADVRDLLARESQDSRAAEALALFCYQAMKWVGAYTAVLSGLDTLVFAGGIGENAAPIRARICAGLGYLGLKLNEEQNSRGLGEDSSALISHADSRVRVHVIKTDEESVIAATTAKLLKLDA